MNRRQYLSRAGTAITASVAVAGCSGGGNDANSDDSGDSDGDGEGTTDGSGAGLFGLAASGDGERTQIEGSVERNVLSGYEVREHVGVVKDPGGDGIVHLSARIENVGSETLRLAVRHTERAVLYGPDGQELDEITQTTTDGQGVNGLAPGETAILDFFGPSGYEPADIGRYGIVLDCRDETIRETDRSPYCPPPE